MDAFTLLIADSDEDFRHALTLALQDSFYVRTCTTGTQALRLLRSCPAHILVVDLMLPELDGLTLLETLNRECICPEVLAFTPDIPPDAALRIAELDISCFLRKPCSLEAAAARITAMENELNTRGAAQRNARQLLRQLRFLPKYDGYDYLLHALSALVENPELTITKHLYPDTAKALGCSACQVERSIRNAIEAAWKLQGSVRHPLFPDYDLRPANGDFLQRAALELRKNLE